MFSSISIIIFLLWIVSACADYNYFCYIWQLKEYRLDRMKDFMATKRGNEFWKKYIILWRSLFAIFVFFWLMNSIILIKYFLVIFFGFEFLRNLFLIFKRKFKHPVFTKKSSLIIFGAILIEGFIFTFSYDWSMLLLLMSIRFFIISFVVLLLYFPTDFIKRYYIWKANEKLAKYKNLIVVGITGSYGKSTVKNFLASILESKFTVIKTPKNINTEIGIAKFIMKNNFVDKDIFVVEMGAYKVGEIDLICKMVKPTIGILTAITEQHLSLFGSIKETQQAKYELLRSLPKNGLAVANSDNNYCREFLDELDCRVVTFGVEEVFQPDFLIEKIDNSSEGIIFSGLMYKKTVNTSAPVIGVHNAKNIAPCYLVADFLGISIEDINNQVKKIALPDNVLNIIKYGKATILDDSYNSNYHGFCAGLDVLGTYNEKKRIVITRGIPELGEKSVELHLKIGSEIAYIADELIIVGNDNAKALIEGVGDKFNKEVLVIENQDDLLAKIKSYKDTDSVILLENRVSSLIHDEINK